MATVYQIITGNGTGNNALILEPRERLIYPFNIPVYNELRWGMFFSYTSVTGGYNSVISDDATNMNGLSSPFGRMFWGLCNATTGTTTLPGLSGSFDYWGLYTDSWVGPANNNGLTSFVNYNGGQSLSKMGTFDSTGRLGAGVNAPIVIYTPNSLSGSGAYHGFQFILNSNNTYSGFAFNQGASPMYIDTSANNLRTLLVSRGSQVSNVDSGFWTSGRVQGASTMGTPNAILIYNPMLNSRMRIHALVVEKYA